MVADFQQLLQILNFFLALCALVWVMAEPCPERAAAERRYWERKAEEWREMAGDEGREPEDH